MPIDQKGRPQQENDQEIEIKIYTVDGDCFRQPLTTDDADGAQDFMDWLRDPKAGPVWTWKSPTVAKLTMIQRCNILGADITGYIEPDGKASKWYQRWMDKVMAFVITNKMRKK